MDVLEFSVQADAEGAEALAAVLSEYAYGGPVIEQTVSPEANEVFDPARPYTVRAFLLMDDSVESKRLALEEAVWHFQQLRPLSEPVVRVLKEEDWANAWKKHYTVQHPGRRIVIQPSWLEYQPQSDELVIQLDPGMAFGSGLHPTTRLCLRALEDECRPGMSVLDVGTGSGILSIAAARLGAQHMDAMDIDPVAVRTTIENMELNGVAAQIHVAESGLDRAGEFLGPYDLIVANILAEVIMSLAPELSARLAAQGRLIVSGILAEKAEGVRQALNAQGLQVVTRTQEEDWVALTAAHA